MNSRWQYNAVLSLLDCAGAPSSSSHSWRRLPASLFVLFSQVSDMSSTQNTLQATWRWLFTCLPWLKLFLFQAVFLIMWVLSDLPSASSTYRSITVHCLVLQSEFYITFSLRTKSKPISVNLNCLCTKQLEWSTYQFVKSVILKLVWMRRCELFVQFLILEM